MNLNERITARLDAGIDANVFERCALALMANHYENVIPIEGGSDGGRDGDIIAPIADEPDSRGRILVTTGDPLSNLKSSHKTWRKFWGAGEAFRVDQLVMITSNNLSDTKRRNIETYCRTHDLPVPRIYARQWLVDSLRRDPDLRVELTGVQGRLESLTAKAPEPSSFTGLFGRDDELAHLRAAVMLTTDVSIVGVPGVGKSRLLAELEGSVHFVDRLARDHLVDDLFAIEPSTVVLDDAHLDLELLEQLVRIRSKERFGFTIVAATWPGTEAPVEALLNDPTRVEVDRLARAALDQMIQALGVRGVRARSLVLEQSDGRPGWAVILARLIINGAGDDLATGQSLLDQVAGLATAIAGSAVLNDALACIAALGAASLEDIEVVATHAGVPYADLIAWLEVTAQGGLVERTNDRWSVLAPLRSLIVASTFFGVRKRRSWVSFAEKFPHDERLDRTVLNVANDVPDTGVRTLANTWFADIAAKKVDEIPLALVEIYSGIDEASADRAAVLARAVLDSPREPQALYGDVSYDPYGAAAERILRGAFRRSCSREAFRGLLNLALADDRPRHQYPDHPMRVIQGMAQYLDPDLGPVDTLRDRILKYALEWFDDDPDEARWQVFAEVAYYVFDPIVEGNWSDPSSHLSFTMSQGVMTPGAMESLLALWDTIDSRVRGEAASNITHRAVAQLCKIFDSWSALAGGITNHAGGASTEDRVVAASGAELVLSTLKVLAKRFPAVPIRVNKRIALVSMWNGGPTSLEELPVGDDRLARFVGVREPDDDDIDVWSADRWEQWTYLARELDKLTAAEGVAEYRRLVVEASILDGNHEGAPFAGTLAEHVTDPGAWVQAAIEARARPLIAPLIAKARLDGADIGDLVMSALEVTELRPEALRAIMYEDRELDDVARTVIRGLTDDDVPFIGDLWIHESVTPILRELLMHTRTAVRALAAVTFGEGARGHGPALPEELRPAWRLALVGAVPEQLPQRSRWRLGEMLKHAVATDPELCADWFIANVETAKFSSRARRLVESFPDVLRNLPRDQKRRIVTTLGAEKLIHSGYAADVLGADTELASDLLAVGVVDGAVLLRSMSGYRDHTVEALAPVLLAAHVAPNHIVARALGGRNWTGHESDAILSDLKFFATLRERQPELAEVCDLAAEELGKELEATRAKEKEDRRRGW
ncbi:ATP-binding protein [Arthrobacter crusticola]|uniref:ATP-binding protein n=1 Tax=Arthrobacter crusticola TaxID=2547960 RepID=A0A4R5TW05_9MICC|nr:ATP-binding protein [Arthrobacter crusticola]TDK25314.1 ATP-binding protein [Arthrobacter crusticola]